MHLNIYKYLYIALLTVYILNTYLRLFVKNAALLYFTAFVPVLSTTVFILTIDSYNTMMMRQLKERTE